MSKILPPVGRGEPSVTTSLRVPLRIMKMLDEIAAESGHTRTSVMVHFLDWALQEYGRDKAAAQKMKR